MASVRRIGAAGLVLGLGVGTVSSLPAVANPGASAPAPTPVPAVNGVLGAVDQGLLGGLLGSLLHGPGGIFGPDGGVLAGSNTLGDVVQGLGGSRGDSLLGGLQAVGAVSDVLASPQIGGAGSFQTPSVGGGVLGGLLGNGSSLLGGVL